MKLTAYALLLMLCSILAVSCAPSPGSVPIVDFVRGQKTAGERDKQTAIVQPAEGQGLGIAPEQETPSNFIYEAFDEQAYMQQRFAGKKVVFPSELEAEGIAARPTAYTVGPEDILRIFIWQSPDLSGETVVRPDGHISLPLVGEVQASGLTVNALQQKLTDAYRAFVLNPQIAVIPLQLNSRRIFLLGQITKSEELAKQGVEFG